ncbi:hypothetical protein IMCC12053_2564 [Celeribacter marinus]|uniref:Uncharacterized protein n=1 Tax=Celeribacter marinus TaxID=1397108 RepID=A0A0N9ZHN6_9RHOB|nr:hypothetical protein IMCC12053_2564 [Celeribacter marinus]
MSSVDPPSETINSRTRPASTPSMIRANVSAKCGAAFRVGIITEIGARMGLGSVVRFAKTLAASHPEYS